MTAGESTTRHRSARARSETVVQRVTAQRIPYAEASRVLLRDSILDGMRDLLLTRDWSSITLSDVARAAGISRQTIYNEFGSRQGLAQGYAMRLADRLVDAVEDAINGNVGDIYAAFLEGFRDFFTESAADPLVISLLTGGTKPDLLQLITTDSGPIITPLLGAADVDLHAQLGARQRGGRRRAGPGHRPAGDELRVDAAGGRSRCGPRPGTSDDAVRRTVRCHRIGLAAAWDGTSRAG